jgi:16S rRNA (adenine1518-N6/adenine1519-N6)-dimethyltransferase
MAGENLGLSPKRILDERGLRPRKRFGQNFLVDPRLAERLALLLPAKAYVIEIGGGTGTLTAALVRHARRLTVLEIDRDLCNILHERFAGQGERLLVICTDVLNFDMGADLRKHKSPRAIYGNLPYYITTPIIERILEAGNAWESAVLMVQREYARRLVARAGSPHYGSLSVFASYFADIAKLLDVGAAGFFPAPDVSSSVVRLTPKVPRVTVRNERLLLWLIRAAFSHRRKTFVNSVLECVPGERASGRKLVESALRAASLPLAIRGERLTLAEYCALADTLFELGFLENQWTTHPTP